MDRTIKFKGEINSKTEEELLELLRKYVRYFTDSFYSFYKIKGKEELQIKINNGELKPEFFLLHIFFVHQMKKRIRELRGLLEKKILKIILNLLNITQN